MRFGRFNQTRALRMAAFIGPRVERFPAYKRIQVVLLDLRSLIQSM